MSDKMREAMIDKDGAVWEKIGGAWSMYKQAAQSVSVPVVGEVVAYIHRGFTTRLEWAGHLGQHDDEQYTPLIIQPATSISADELAELREKAAMTEAEQEEKAKFAFKCAALTAELDDLRKDAEEKKELPLDAEVRWILGRPNFACGDIARTLRTLGHVIATKAEDEQAVVIHWMLDMYRLHGADWRNKANAVLVDAAIAGETEHG